MALDPPPTAAAGGSGGTSSRPKSPFPHLQPHPQPLFSHPIRAPTPHLAKPNRDPSHPFLFPFSGGSGFVPGYLPPPLVYSHGVRAMASAHLDYLHQALHLARPPPQMHYPHMGHSPATAPVKGAPVSAHPKAAPHSVVSEGKNGCKDTSTRQRNREDTFFVVRDRKVRITEDASLYSLCRSWLRNGINEESQPQQKDAMKALPKPLPSSVVANYMSNKKEDDKEDEEEENEKFVEHLSPQDLLKRHIKHAKRVRGRLREERLQRITRYRSRLRLLLPPPVEQFRNDTAVGN